MSDHDHLCDDCGKPHGPRPFYARLKAHPVPRFILCPLCAGKMCHSLIKALQGWKAEDKAAAKVGKK